MSKKAIFITLLGLFLLGSLNLLEAQPQIRKGVRGPGQEVTEPAERVAIRDNPVIREFSINPSCWLAGQSGNAIFSWRVEPSPGGTSITRITITKTEGAAPGVNTSSSNSSGQYTLDIPSSIGRGRTVYALTAVNKAGNTSTATLNFDVRTLDYLRGEIFVRGFTISPSEILEGTAPVDYIIIVENRSPIAVSEVTVRLNRWPAEHPSRLSLLTLTNQTIRQGINEYRIRDNNGIRAILGYSICLFVLPQDLQEVTHAITCAEGFSEVSRTDNYYRVRLRR